jgi:hypothetical protein
MENYSAIRKNEMMSFTGKWMEVEMIMLSEIRQAQKGQVWHDEDDKNPNRR